MRTPLLAAASALLLIAGCAKPAPPVDLSIPKLSPKPVIWVEDWKGVGEVNPERAKATELMRQGDALKSQQQYADAEAVYRQAIDADPTFPYPRYQLACNYELKGDQKSSVPQFEKAIELGLDDYPTVLDDSELGSIRNRRDFKDMLMKVRERYLKTAESRVGQPIAVRPPGAKPASGWPAILLLHGYGDTNISYLDHADLWAQFGFIAVAVPGSVPAHDGRFIWDQKSADPTQNDVRAILDSPLLVGLIDPKRVYLHGFSQGALHSMILTMEHPDQYAGVVAVSPGGSIAERIVQPKLPDGAGRLRCVFVHGDQEAYALPIEKAWRAACEQSKWKYLSLTHPGSHHFPRNWVEKQPEIVAFLNSAE
jgi:predicted esterase